MHFRVKAEPLEHFHPHIYSKQMIHMKDSETGEFVDVGYVIKYMFFLTFLMNCFMGAKGPATVIFISVLVVVDPVISVCVIGYTCFLN